VRDGDVIRLDATTGTLDVLLSESQWAARQAEPVSAAHQANHAAGLGRELFAGMRRNVQGAEQGAVTWL
jgi:phosphogluconate dehydratase